MIEDSYKKIKASIEKKPTVKKILKKALQYPLAQKRLHEIELYNLWLNKFELTNNSIIRQKKQSKLFKYKPLISIITPIYNTPESYFKEMVKSVLAQTYDNWELILVDDASSDGSIRTEIKACASSDKRIKFKFLDTNHHIAGATNKGIKIANGEFISLFDHDDILRPDALFEIVSVLNVNKELDFIYTDEDKIAGDDMHRSDPFFKPDWNPDLLYSINYITHFITIRKTILDKFGYENGDYNGAQDWELFLRITRNIATDRIHHIPKILYSWRVHEASTAMNISSKPYVIESQRKAINDDLKIKKQLNYILNQDDLFPGQWQVLFKPRLKPKVSIVVFNESIKKYISKNTIYENFEIILVAKYTSAVDIIRKIDHGYLVVVNKRIKINNPDWLGLLLGDATRGDIGFVMAGFRSDVFAIKSMSLMINGLALPFLKKISNNSLTKHYYITARYNIPVIQKKCVFMVDINKLYRAINDFDYDEDFVKISGKMALSRCRNLYNPYVKL